MINEIKKSILNKYPFKLQDSEKKELDQFLENYIAHLSITDFVVSLPSETEIELTIITNDKIAELSFFRDRIEENQFRCSITIFPINQIAHLVVYSTKQDGDLYNVLLIESNKSGNITFVYAHDDHDAIRFVQRLLTI